MSKSTENSKKGSSKEVNKVVWKLKDYRLKASEGERIQVGSSAGAFVVGGSLVSKMKNLKKKKRSTKYSGSDTDEDYMTFLRMAGLPADIV